MIQDEAEEDTASEFAVPPSDTTEQADLAAMGLMEWARRFRQLRVAGNLFLNMSSEVRR